MAEHDTGSKEVKVFGSNQFVLVPGGGVALFSKDEFLLEDWAGEVINRQSYTPSSQWASWVLACRGLLANSQFEHLLSELSARRLIGKEEVLTLYRMQSEDVRARTPYLTLEMMWSLRIGGGIGDDVFPRRENGLQMFEKEDILSLADEVISISTSDVRMFMRQWFYREECMLSLKFLSYWFEGASRYFDDLDGKDQALLAISYYEKKSKSPFRGKRAWRELFFKQIQRNIETLAHREPGSHGLPRYVSLLYWVAREIRHKEKQKGMENEISATISSMVIETIRPEGRCSLYHGNFILSLYLEDPGIPEIHKKEIAERVRKACQVFASEYLRFVDKALEDAK